MKPVETTIKPRKPWLAFLLSLLVAGLGQVYNGQWKKGLLFFLAESICGMTFVAAFGSFGGLVASVGFLVLFNIVMAVEAFVSARSLGGYVPKQCNRVWVYLLFFCMNLLSGAVVEHVLGANYYKTYTAPSGSMLPTIQIDDDFMVEVIGDDENPKRGDIVVFEFPEDRTIHFIKRVVGLPGEVVGIQDKQVMINGTPLKEEYAYHVKEVNVPVRDNFEPVELGPDEFFLMGDNRENSYDSRFFGPVGRSAIFGRALYVYFPVGAGSDGWFDRLGAELR